jgi:uncharacterized protein YndB with AHSA1/START domain
MDKLRLEAWFPVPPETVYRAWIDGKSHSAMTGAEATSQGIPGGEYTAWDGYIRGRYQVLSPDTRILMSWRTSYFGEQDPDSILELIFNADGKGTHVDLVHTNLPPGSGEEYAQGWKDHYFAPMADYFGGGPDRP